MNYKLTQICDSRDYLGSIIAVYDSDNSFSVISMQNSKRLGRISDSNSYNRAPVKCEIYLERENLAMNQDYVTIYSEETNSADLICNLHHAIKSKSDVAQQEILRVLKQYNIQFSDISNPVEVAEWLIDFFPE